MTNKDKAKIEFCNCLVDKTDIMNASMYAESYMRQELKEAKEKFDNNIINEMTYESIEKDANHKIKVFNELYDKAENTPSCKMSSQNRFYNEPRED